MLSLPEKLWFKTNYENRIRLLRLLLHPMPNRCRRSNGLCPPARRCCRSFPNAWRTRPPASDGIRIWPLRVEALCGCEILRTISEAEDKITRQTPTRLSSPPAPAIRSAKSHTPSPTGRSRWPSKPICATRRPTLIALATNDALGATLENIALTIEKKEHILRPFAQDDPIGKPTSLVCDFRLLPDALDCAAAYSSSPCWARPAARMPKRLTRRPKRLFKSKAGRAALFSARPPA